MKNTINYLGHEFEFDFNYQPAERRTHDYPGIDEEFTIYNITLNGIDVTDLLDRQMDDFEEQVVKQLKDN